MRRASLLVLMVLSATACQKVLGFEDFEEGTTASGGGGAAGTGTGGTAGATGGTAGVATGGGGAGGTAGAAPCEDPKAPTGMIGLRRPIGTCVWIDPYEVTREQYQEYVASAPTTQPSFCDWNTSLATPEASQGNPACTTSAQADAGTDAGSDAGSDAGTDGGAPKANLPVTCVDWCDAASFCVSKGKKLCPGDKVFSADPNKSAWYLACAGANKWAYPYAATYSAGACNDSCGTSCELAPVGSSTNCKSPEGVFDLTGNVGEWVDECSNTSATGECHIRGGTMQDDLTGASCSTATGQVKKYGLARVGFRCCWEPS